MNTGDKTILFWVTEEGHGLAGRIKGLYPDLVIRKFSKKAVGEAWTRNRTLLFVMAAGIVVRTISSHVKDKRTDPAVIVLDDRGRNVVSLLSGHLGGANATTEEIARFLGANAVITTGSDVAGVPFPDPLAPERGVTIEGWEGLPSIATRFINQGSLKIFSEAGTKHPPEFIRVSDPGKADLLVTNRRNVGAGQGLYLRPRNLVAGIGCNRGTSAREIEDAVRSVLDTFNLSFLSLFRVATIDLKNHEPGLVAFCKTKGFELVSFAPAELNAVPGVTSSEAAKKATGAKAVAEPAALLGSGSARLLVNKQKQGNVTVAIAETKDRAPLVAGKIYVIGTGPGGMEHITPRAVSAIRHSDVIVGYGTYMQLIEGLLRDKEVFTTGMTREVERCRKAIELAREGKTASVISGGDPGIYAMAGLVFELLMKESEGLPVPPVEVIPGISALNASAARLGAPLMHDFASISLSDRLTPWEVIEKRLDAAAAGDFVIILYNPRSRGRAEHIKKAREIIARHRSPDTPAGIVRRAMREGESTTLTTLGAMADQEIDMQSTVIIGNSRTFTWKDIMITPRGYEGKMQGRLKAE
jgi:cobalt-precorrin 5A hydrolase / precorrin-3B C17-methyltransferase